MKRLLIFALVGGVTLWFWQFLSYAIVNLHEPASRYTPMQDEILAALAPFALEPGQYYLGQPSPEEVASGGWDAAKYQGKPWAVLHWEPVKDSSMVMPIVRSILICILTAGLFYALVRRLRSPSPLNGLTAGVGVGLIGYFFIPYSDFIWYETPGIVAHLIDAVVPWSLVGLLAGKMASREG